MSTPDVKTPFPSHPTAAGGALVVAGPAQPPPTGITALFHKRVRSAPPGAHSSLQSLMPIREDGPPATTAAAPPSASEAAAATTNASPEPIPSTKAEVVLKTWDDLQRFCLNLVRFQHDRSILPATVLAQINSLKGSHTPDLINQLACLKEHITSVSSLDEISDGDSPEDLQVDHIRVKMHIMHRLPFDILEKFEKYHVFELFIFPKSLCTDEKGLFPQKFVFMQKIISLYRQIRLWSKKIDEDSFTILYERLRALNRAMRFVEIFLSSVKSTDKKTVLETKTTSLIKKLKGQIKLLNKLKTSKESTIKNGIEQTISNIKPILNEILFLLLDIKDRIRILTPTDGSQTITTTTQLTDRKSNSQKAPPPISFRKNQIESILTEALDFLLNQTINIEESLPDHPLPPKPDPREYLPCIIDLLNSFADEKTINETNQLRLHIYNPTHLSWAEIAESLAFGPLPATIEKYKSKPTPHMAGGDIKTDALLHKPATPPPPPLPPAKQPYSISRCIPKCMIGTGVIAAVVVVVSALAWNIFHTHEEIPSTDWNSFLKA